MGAQLHTWGGDTGSPGSLPALFPGYGLLMESGAPGGPSWLPEAASVFLWAATHGGVSPVPRPSGMPFSWLSWRLSVVSFPARVCLRHSAGLSQFGFSFGRTSLMSQPQEASRTFPAVPFCQVHLKCTDRQGWTYMGLGGAQGWVLPASAAGSPSAPGPPLWPLSGQARCWRVGTGSWKPPPPSRLWFTGPFLAIKTVPPPSRRPGHSLEGREGCVPGTRKKGGASEGLPEPAGQCRWPGWVPSVWLGHPGLTSACFCWLWASCRTCPSSCMALKSSSLSSLVSSSFSDRAWQDLVGGGMLVRVRGPPQGEAAAECWVLKPLPGRVVFLIPHPCSGRGIAPEAALVPSRVSGAFLLCLHWSSFHGHAQFSTHWLDDQVGGWSDTEMDGGYGWTAECVDGGKDV